MVDVQCQATEDEKRFKKTSDSTDPVQYGENIPLDALTVQAHLINNRNVIMVEEFVWPLTLQHNIKDFIYFRVEFTKRDGILKFQHCDVDMVYVLCAELAVDWVPNDLRVFRDHVVSVVILLEAILVLKGEDELTTEPCDDLGVALA